MDEGISNSRLTLHSKALGMRKSENDRLQALLGAQQPEIGHRSDAGETTATGDDASLACSASAQPPQQIEAGETAGGLRTRNADRVARLAPLTLQLVQVEDGRRACHSTRSLLVVQTAHNPQHNVGSTAWRPPAHTDNSAKDPAATSQEGASAPLISIASDKSAAEFMQG